MANLAQIYDWFMTGKKPTQAQFWASWGSFWNKEETIPQSAITNLTTVLNAKTENDQFNAHKVALDAHTNLFLGKEDKDQKGAANGYAPLDATIKIASDYLNIVNDLVTGGATSLASAETVKNLKTQINAINLLLTSDNLNLDTVQEIVDAIETVQTSLSTILVNDLTTGGTTKALTAEMGKTLKGLIDGMNTGKQAALVSGTNIKTVNGVTILGSGNLLTPDMDTTSSQTVSGLKTFLNGLFGLRNIANTFTSFFTNSNTASRTYTLQDRNGTLADLTDIASVNTNKMNVPTGGIINYLPKFLTATTQGLSRLWDTGTFFGFGTVNAPIKDLTLGNQSDRSIGIELSESTVKGRDLVINAGATINYLLSATLQPTVEPRTFLNMWKDPNSNDIYGATWDAGLYKQIGGTGAFLSDTTIGGQCLCGTMAKNGDRYLASYGGQIYIRASGQSTYVIVSNSPSLPWTIMTATPNGDVYASCGQVASGGWGNNTSDIYKRTAGSGDFVAMGFTGRGYRVFGSPNGDVYATVRLGSIYLISVGTSVFTDLLQTARLWEGMAFNASGSVAYAIVNGGDIYKRESSVGNFIATNQPTVKYWSSILINNFEIMYASGYLVNLHMVSLASLGTVDLDGGTLKNVAGTGKGTGKSRWQVSTGQKTTSGTDMQIETKRLEIDENGHFQLFTMPAYADNAAALAGGLVAGKFYRTSTGVLMITY